MKCVKLYEKVEIGIYSTFEKYFALGISGYKMEEIKSEDKSLLGFQIRNKLNERGIKQCIIRPMKNGMKDYFPVNESELEMIAIAMSFDIDKTNLKIELNKKIYIKNE